MIRQEWSVNFDGVEVYVQQEKQATCKKAFYTQNKRWMVEATTSLYKESENLITTTKSEDSPWYWMDLK